MLALLAIILEHYKVGISLHITFANIMTARSLLVYPHSERGTKKLQPVSPDPALKMGRGWPSLVNHTLYIVTHTKGSGITAIPDSFCWNVIISLDSTAFV